MLVSANSAKTIKLLSLLSPASPSSPSIPLSVCMCVCTHEPSLHLYVLCVYVGFYGSGDSLEEQGPRDQTQTISKCLYSLSHPISPFCGPLKGHLALDLRPTGVTPDSWLTGSANTPLQPPFRL